MYDVIILGAGVAGPYLATQLKGLDTLIIEKDQKPVLKDSGIVSNHFKKFFREPSLIQSRIEEMQFVSPSGQRFFLTADEPFAFILNRKQFALHLRKKAKVSAKLKYEKVRKINYLENSVEVQTNKGIHSSKLLIGADGASSIVRRSLGIRDPLFYTGIFARTRKKIEKHTIGIYLNKYFSPDFFSWIIPQNNEYGLTTAIRPYENFQYFKKQLNLPDGEIHSSPIPIGYTRSYAERTILLGDACGHVKPLTGGGIIFSMTAANHAACIINRAFEKNRFDKDFLKQYEKQWKKDLKCEINKQLFARKIYRKLSNNDIDKMFRSFGPEIENLKVFDYDKLSGVWRRMPKWKLFKFLISSLPLLISKTYH